MKFYLRTSTLPPKTNIETNKYNNHIAKPKAPIKCKLQKNNCCKSAIKRKKINFFDLKKDTINSLNEVEHFLCNFQNIYKYIKLYKILK